jgi:hypothetical protein
LEGLKLYEPLRPEIISFWRDTRHRGEHAAQRNIEDMVLTTALVPGGFLRLT